MINVGDKRRCTGGQAVPGTQASRRVRHAGRQPLRDKVAKVKHYATGRDLDAPHLTPHVLTTITKTATPKEVAPIHTWFMRAGNDVQVLVAVI
jgi:hypothetical protein